MEQRRRSLRTAVRIPFVACALTMREEGETEVVNAHGALVKLRAELRVGDIFTIQHPAGSPSKLARVVNIQRPAADGKARLGVELDTPSGLFWSELAR